MISDVMAPEVKRVRAYFAPVDRSAKQPTLFDPARDGSFAVTSAPAPWVDLGWIHDFERVSETTIVPLRSGSPAATQAQVRNQIEAKVTFTFESWGKLQLALSAGSQQMNLLAVQGGATAAASGGAAVAAVGLIAGSTATSLCLSATDAASFSVGQLVAVNVDYVTGSTGFVGSGVSGAYVKTALSDVDYVRRVTLNVGRIECISSGVLTLEAPLVAGAPGASMKVSPVVGFCDREGSSYFQEWSGLFVAEGQQGERVIWYYPRLQTLKPAAELPAKGHGGYQAMRLQGAFRAMPVTDAVDGERIVCFRSFLTD